MTSPATDNAEREQVLTWLAGRLRFEQLLADLHQAPERRRSGEVAAAAVAAELVEPVAAKAA